METTSRRSATRELRPCVTIREDEVRPQGAGHPVPNSRRIERFQKLLKIADIEPAHVENRGPNVYEASFEKRHHGKLLQILASMNDDGIHFHEVA